MNRNASKTMQTASGFLQFIPFRSVTELENGLDRLQETCKRPHASFNLYRSGRLQNRKMDWIASKKRANGLRLPSISTVPVGYRTGKWTGSASRNVQTASGFLQFIPFRSVTEPENGLDRLQETCKRLEASYLQLMEQLETNWPVGF